MSDGRFPKGNVPWNKGKHHSIETREKISLKHTGFKHTDASRRNMSLSRIGRIATDKTREKLRVSKLGSKNPSWKGGKTQVHVSLRMTTPYYMWRSAVFTRDDFTCNDCGQRGGRIEAHHIKPFSVLIKEAVDYLPLLNKTEACLLYTPLWDVDNGITLCKTCHGKYKKGGGKSVKSRECKDKI